MAQNRIIEFEAMFEFLKCFLITFDVHQNIVRFVQFLDEIGKLASTPIFQTMDFS